MEPGDTILDAHVRGIRVRTSIFWPKNDISEHKALHIGGIQTLSCAQYNNLTAN
jgi:hypothetical protein